jgi:hypothetical protein
MKKPNIDLSQEGLKKFFLHHIEKVILGGSVAALAFLLWNGWSTEKYDKTEPAKLSQLATRAKSHIDKDTWTDISEFREGDDKADDRIEAANKFKTDADQYAVRRLIGTPKAKKGLRTDPSLVSPTDLVARPFTSSVLIDMKYNPDFTSTLSSLRLATASDSDTDDEEDQRGSAGGNIGDEGSDDEDDKKDDKDKDPFGNTVTGTQQLEMVGFRPTATQQGLGGSGKGSPFVLDGIAVTGVVNFGEQYKSYEAALSNAIGYYPLRDRPVYVYLEIQRREFDPDPADQDAYDKSWVDISNNNYEDMYGVERAPEIVAPDHFDQTLTRNIPPLVNYDYRKLAIHPKTVSRKMVPPAIKDRNVVKKVDPGAVTDAVFGGGGSEPSGGADDGEKNTADADGEKEKNEVKDTDVNTMKGDNRVLYEKINPLSPPKTDLKLVRFFDFPGSRDVGKTFQYRVRLWLNDPNDPKGDVKGGALEQTKDDGENQRGSAMNPSEGNDSDSETEQDIDEDLLKAKWTALKDNLLEQDVRTRTRKKVNEIPKFSFRGLPNENEENKNDRDLEVERRENYVDSMEKLLEAGWATDWSEPTAPVRLGSTPASYYAGSVVQPSVLRIGESTLPRTEPALNLVTSFWSNSVHAPSGEEAYNTAIPSLRTVRRGDVLNYKITKAHVLDPSNGAVKRIKDTRIKTDTVVLDMMGGDTVGRFDFPVQLATEALVMDANGNFHLQNSDSDRIGYRHSLFLEDEGNEFGKAKKKRNTEDRGNADF